MRDKQGKPGWGGERSGCPQEAALPGERPRDLENDKGLSHPGASLPSFSTDFPVMNWLRVSWGKEQRDRGNKKAGKERN